MAFSRKTNTNENSGQNTNQVISAKSSDQEAKKPNNTTSTLSTKLSGMAISPNTDKTIEKHSKAIIEVISTKVEEATKKTKELNEIDEAITAVSTKLIEYSEIIKKVEKKYEDASTAKCSVIEYLNESAEHVLKLGFVLENDGAMLKKIQQNFKDYSSSPPATEFLITHTEVVRKHLLTVTNNYIDTFKLQQKQKQTIIEIKNAVDKHLNEKKSLQMNPASK